MPDSSSSSIVYGDYGREPIGIAQKLGYEYPLVQPSDDIRYLIADLYLNYEDPADYDDTATERALPFKIAWLHGVGGVASVRPAWAPLPTHDVDCIIRDDDDATVFDSTTASVFHTKVWSNRLTIYEWVTSTSVLRIVVHTRWSDDGPTAVNYLYNIAPTVGTIDARAIIRQPKRVKSIKVGVQELVGDLTLTEGYNCDYTVRALSTGAGYSLTRYGQRQGNVVSLDLSPGGGLGRYPGCAGMDVVLRRINSVGPNTHGDFFLEPHQCYWWEVPSTVASLVPRVTNFTANSLQLHNNCPACCQCDDFVELKHDIDDQYALWLADALGAERARNTYRRMKKRWNREIACRVDDNQRLLVEPRCDQYVGVGYSFCPVNEECAGPLSMTFNVVTNPIGLDVRVRLDTVRKNTPENRYMAPYTLGGAFPNWTASWTELDNMYSARLGFVMKVCDGGVGDTLTVTTSGTFDGNALNAMSETVTIEDDCAEDGDPCP